MEAWRRELDPLVSRSPVAKAGPAHIATLKTFDPPLRALEGRQLAGARRVAKRLLFPTADGELVLLVHLMTAGRLRFLEPGAKAPKSPAFRLAFADGGELVLTEGGTKRAAGVWLLHPEAAEALLAHLGPDAHGLGPERLGAILRADARRLHALLRDQRALAGIGRAWANEILHAARLSPYALSTQLADGEIERLAAASTASWSAASPCASRARRMPPPTACTTAWASRATCAPRPSRASTSRSTRSSTARSARPAAASSRTGGCRGS
jgi:formamidopyrimidine-DNA glycosylase